ncbi:MAG: hypothetical protein L0271_02790 [Gemmatimonadetes bacterium]|nr:hypothetical protein [Gemmatimonadota bacterium]
MRRLQLAHRDRRALRLLVIIAVPAALNSFAVQPYRGAHADARAQLHVERDLLMRERSLLDREAGYRELLRTVHVAADSADMRLFHAGNMALAEAGITTYVQQIATLSAVTLRAIDAADPDSAGGGLRRCPLVLRGEAGLESLLLFLQRIERGPRLVRISELTIQPLSTRRRSGAMEQDGPWQAGLSFDIQLDGYVDVSEAPPAESPATPTRSMP